MANDIPYYAKDWVAKCRAFYNKKWVARNLSSYLIADKDEWAYCPKCKLEWNTKHTSPLFSTFLNQPARHLVKAKLQDKEKRPDKLCPLHGECTMYKRRMGKVKRVNKRRLDKINRAGCIHCPNCKSPHLRQFGQNESLWICKSCNSFIVVKKGYLNGISGEIGVVQMSYREDLETKEGTESKKLLSKMVKIMQSPGVKIDGCMIETVMRSKQSCPR